MLGPKPLVILAISIIALAGLLAVQPLNFQRTARTSSLLENCIRPPGYILLVLNNNGFNNSISQGRLALEFQRGDTVNMLVCNLDNVQAHGFAVDHYFDKGVTLKPGESYKISFVSGDTGVFTIYCNVFCTVHTFMLGRLTIA